MGEHFGAWLKRTMDDHDRMTQATLARELDVEQSLVSRWVRGVARPSPKNCRAGAGTPHA